MQTGIYFASTYKNHKDTIEDPLERPRIRERTFNPPKAITNRNTPRMLAIPKPVIVYFSIIYWLGTET